MGNVGSPAGSRWAEYEIWNRALADLVFPELETPEPVYLDLEDELLQELAARTGVDVDSVEEQLAGAVRATLARGGPATVFDSHEIRARRWVRGGRSEDPPFLAVLAVFCLAAERMEAGDGMSVTNFFGRLRGVLGWDDKRLDQAYRRVAEWFWGELNRWLVEQDGQRGLPTAFALSHRYVGLTVSQALVRSGDREQLKDFFREYGFSPGMDVPPNDLEPVLDAWMRQRPCPASRSLETLWGRKNARSRIAQAAAVALASWDGSVRERESREGGSPARAGHLSLVMRMGTFPRKSFDLGALLYLPNANVPRQADVLTASTPTTIDLAPDLPGSLGLALGSSFHAEDVLAGVLRVRDHLTGREVQRRPRRAVLFREDELSRRWIESAQVMLGDSVRLMVHESLLARAEVVLGRVARPGWEVRKNHRGLPEGWVVITGLEVFEHPGDLVKTDNIDDLACLVPLTSNQLKVAGGFALPGQMRGKWHSWQPPEIRASSDSPGGFSVRLVDMRRYDELDVQADAELVLAEWSDDGAGALVAPLAELELPDGDYRAELLPSGSKEPLSAQTILLRSADTPDHKQWATLTGHSYGGALAVLGVPGAPDETPTVSGHIVSGPSVQDLDQRVAGDIPQEWATGRSASGHNAETEVRLAVPDPTSCIYTGAHKSWIDTPPHDSKGKPLVPWTTGRCRTCGLERRYMTNPHRIARSKKRAEEEREEQAARQVDVAALPAVEATTDLAPWATAFDAVLHTGGGRWNHLERIAVQLDADPRFVDQFARTLEVLGHIEVSRDPATLKPVAWETSPTVLAGTENGLLFSGHWSGTLYEKVGGALEEQGVSLVVESSAGTLDSYYADCSPTAARGITAVAEHEVGVVDLAWCDLLSALPPLSHVMSALPRSPDRLVGQVTRFDVTANAWGAAEDLQRPGAYRVRQFATTDVFRTEDDVARGEVARATVQLGKHLAALLEGVSLVAYDASAKRLTVPLGADLPGLYGRAAVASWVVRRSPVGASVRSTTTTCHPRLAAGIHTLLTR